MNDYNMTNKLVAHFRQGFKFDQDNYFSDPYESNVNFSERLMIEKDISGMSWIQCPAEKYKVKNMKNVENINQIEIDFEDLISLKDYEEMAPLRTMSFDIECHSFGKFPDPHKHQINTMGFVC